MKKFFFCFSLFFSFLFAKEELFCSYSFPYCELAATFLKKIPTAELGLGYRSIFSKKYGYDLSLFLDFPVSKVHHRDFIFSMGAKGSFLFYFSDADFCASKGYLGAGMGMQYIPFEGRGLHLPRSCFGFYPNLSLGWQWQNSVRQMFVQIETAYPFFSVQKGSISLPIVSLSWGIGF